ncbi:hypothetical protein HDU86_004199 [Geranomyces michiganensis]|nr:hypothetical protein HDU86_004199 [Geranomyces michiganensis]
MTGPAATTEKATQTDAQPKKGAQTDAQPEKGAQTHAPPVRWYFYVEPEDYDDYYDYRDEDPNDNMVSEGLDYDPECDGDTISPSYSSTSTERQVARPSNKADKLNKINRLYVDQPANAAFIRHRLLYPERDKGVVLWDPNIRDMGYTKKFGTKQKMRYTLPQHQRETKARQRVKECNRDRLRNLTVPGVQPASSLESIMPSHKSMRAEAFEEWLRFQVEHLEAFQACYASSTRWNRRRFEAARVARKSEDRFVNRFRKHYGRNPVVVMSDWEKVHRSLMHQPPIKTKRFRTMFARNNITVFLIDEYRTSSRCPDCFQPVEQGFRKRPSPTATAQWHCP